MYPKNKPKRGVLQGEIDNVSPETLFEEFDNKIKKLFNVFNIKSLLHRVGIRKSQGYSPRDLLYLWVLHPFLKKRRTALWSHEELNKSIQAQKDTFYRFLSKTNYNWRNFIYQLFFQIQRHLHPVPYRERCLVADLSLLKKTGKHIEFVSRMFDHGSKQSILCFPTLFLGYFDGRSFFPIDFAVSATKKRPNTHEKKVDKRSCSYRRRKEAKAKTTDTLISMIKMAYNRGVDASYLLFDSWFAHDVIIKKVLDIGYHVICRCPVRNVKYSYKGAKYTAKQLFSKVIRKQMKWNAKLGFYIASVNVILPKTGEVTLVFCQSERKTKFALFLSTDTELENSEILKKYANRWSIEMFFRDAKQHLALGKEQNRDFEAVIAHISFVLIRYNLLSFMIRLATKREPIGELFESISDKIAQTTVIARLWEFFKHLLMMSSEILFGDSEKRTINKLIDYIENTIGTPMKSLLFEGAKV